MGIRERLRILSIESDPAVGGALREIIEEILPEGSQLDLTPSIRVALSRIRGGEVPYDLITTCYQAVDGKGDEFVAQARQAPGYERVPIIAITGSEGGMITEQFKRVGVNTILPKPLADEQLQEAVKNSLKPRR